MKIEKTPLYDEIQAIMFEPVQNYYSTYECFLITPEIQVRPLKLNSKDTVRDYLRNFTDVITIEVLVPRGVLFNQLMPHREELEVKLDKVPIRISEENPRVSKIYSAIILNEKDATIAAQVGDGEDEQSMNLDLPVTIQLQLIDKATEQIRTFPTGFTLRNEIPGNAAKYMLTRTSQLLNLPEEERILGVNNVPWDNQEKRKNIVIEQGTPIGDIVPIVQDEQGGIYNTGCGVYLQNRIWYIWPEFNVRRFEKERKTLIIINIPPNKYAGMEKTFRYDRFQLTVLSTGQSVQKDLSHHQKLNKGNATRYTETDQFFASQNASGKNFGEAKENRFKINRSDNNVEYVGAEKGSYNVAPVSSDRMSNNAFSQSSKLARRKGSVVRVVWEHASSDAIFPGMPTRLFYLKNDEIRSLDATVIHVQEYTYDTERGPIAGNFITNTAITLFTESDAVEEPDDG